VGLRQSAGVRLLHPSEPAEEPDDTFLVLASHDSRVVGQFELTHEPSLVSLAALARKCIPCYPRMERTDPETNGVPMETRCLAACTG